MFPAGKYLPHSCSYMQVIYLGFPWCYWQEYKFFFYSTYTYIHMNVLAFIPILNVKGVMTFIVWKLLYIWCISKIKLRALSCGYIFHVNVYPCIHRLIVCTKYTTIGEKSWQRYTYVHNNIYIPNWVVCVYFSSLVCAVIWEFYVGELLMISNIKSFTSIK